MADTKNENEQTLPPYKEGTYSDRNTGRACWSCAGLDHHAPGDRCIYPDSHRPVIPPGLHGAGERCD